MTIKKSNVQINLALPDAMAQRIPAKKNKERSNWIRESIVQRLKREMPQAGGIAIESGNTRVRLVLSREMLEKMPVNSNRHVCEWVRQAIAQRLDRECKSGGGYGK
jgi:predicted transcriptional regulator